MPSPRAIRYWSTIHTWTSLISTVFLLMLCLTGLPLIFHDELDALSGDRIVAPSLPAATADANLDQIVANARHLHPELTVRTVYYDQDNPHVVKVGLVPGIDAPISQARYVALDQRSAAVLTEPASGKTLLDTVMELHETLLAGLPGTLLLGLMGLIFMLAIVSGVVVYAPFMRRLEFGTVRLRRSPRLRWLDLHNLLGIVTVSWLLVVGATGVMNTLSRPLFGLWTMQVLPPLLAPYAHKPRPEHYAPVQQAVTTVRQALPHKQITSVIFPTLSLGSPRHYVIWTHGDSPVTSRLYTPVLVDVETGRLTMAQPLPWYLRTLELSRPLHFGDYGGLPLKIIWALFDLSTIVVLLSGLWLWLKRRRSGTGRGPSATASGAEAEA